MSFRIGVAMSLKEKGTWAYPAGAVVIRVIYTVHVFGQLGQLPVAEIVWGRPMLIAIAAGVVVGIVVGIAATMLIAATKPSEAGQRDVRDK